MKRVKVLRAFLGREDTNHTQDKIRVVINETNSCSKHLNQRRYLEDGNELCRKINRRERGVFHANFACAKNKNKKNVGRRLASSRPRATSRSLSYE